MGGMYLTFKHFMKSPVCNSKARCDKPQNSELKTNFFLKNQKKVSSLVSEE